jgi:HSP20 family protein
MPRSSKLSHPDATVQQEDLMASEKKTRGNENTPRQQAATTQSTPDARQQGAERQRSIQTNREPATSAALNRSPSSSSMVYGPTVTPLALMRRMADDMDRMFQEFGLGGGSGLRSLFGSPGERDPWRQLSSLEQRVWAPQIETFRRGDKLVVRADLPGLSREDVQVEIDNGVLSLSGQRSEENEENRDDFYRTERSYGRFYRSIALPDGVEADDVEATFKDGVLEVTMPAPRQADRSARQIPIR